MENSSFFIPANLLAGSDHDLRQAIKDLRFELLKRKQLRAALKYKLASDRPLGRFEK